MQWQYLGNVGEGALHSAVLDLCAVSGVQAGLAACHKKILCGGINRECVVRET